MYEVKENKLEFSQRLLDFNKLIYQKIEKEGIHLIVPQRDINQKRPGNEIREEEFGIIRGKDCNGLIMILGHTPGIWAEAGYAKAFDKKNYGLKLKNSWNLDWLNSLFDFVSEDIDELIMEVKKNDYR